MNVQLINYTQRADRVLVFTKETRLGVTAARWEAIQAMDDSQVAETLQYMAKTIPSSWEFVDYIFLVEGVSRAYTHQQVRTRTGAYAQQSMRVTNMAEFEYVFTEANQANHLAMSYLNQCLRMIKETYISLTSIGQAEEDARGILPTNIATNIVCKFDLRTMADLARSRTGGRTQKEYQAVVNAMLDQVLHVHPWAEPFLFGAYQRDYFAELEAFAVKAFPDLKQRGELLKIVDAMRKAA